MEIKFTLAKGALAPQRAHPSDAAWDLYVPLHQPVDISCGYPTIVDTGVTLELPPDHFALILPRSGLAAKQGITIINSPGLIDSGYRGTLQVILTAFGPQGMIRKLPEGSRIAQLLILPQADITLTYERNINSATDRGTSGLGSTGV